MNNNIPIQNIVLSKLSAFQSTPAYMNVLPGWLLIMIGCHTSHKAKMNGTKPMNLFVIPLVHPLGLRDVLMFRLGDIYNRLHNPVGIFLSASFYKSRTNFFENFLVFDVLSVSSLTSSTNPSDPTTLSFISSSGSTSAIASGLPVNLISSLIPATLAL